MLGTLLEILPRNPRSQQNQPSTVSLERVRAKKLPTSNDECNSNKLHLRKCQSIFINLKLAFTMRTTNKLNQQRYQSSNAFASAWVCYEKLAQGVDKSQSFISSIHNTLSISVTRLPRASSYSRAWRRVEVRGRCLVSYRRHLDRQSL